MALLTKRDSKGRVVKGSASPNNSAQRRVNRMRELMDEKFGEDSRTLIDHLSKIAFGEMSLRVTRTLRSIRKRQGNDAIFEQEELPSDKEVVIQPSVREMLDATALLLQYHVGRPQQTVDVQVEHTTAQKMDLSKLTVDELEAYQNALAKALVETDDGVVDAEFKSALLPEKTDSHE